MYINKVDETSSFTDAVKKIAPYNVIKGTCFAGIGNTPFPEPDPDKCSLICSDTKQVLGYHGVGYTYPQPYEAFESFQPLIDTGLMQLDTAGTLNDRAIIWVAAKLTKGNAEIIPGDEMELRLLFSTSYDGSYPTSIGRIYNQIVCQNTYRQAVKEGDLLKFKHTINAPARIQAATEGLQQALVQFQADIEMFKILANKKVTQKQLEAYVYNVFELDPEAELSTKTVNKVNHVIELLETQKGLEYIPAKRGTAWQGVSAITQYLTHEAGRTEDSRIESNWFGQNAKLTNRAVELAFQMN